jgi:hypothetical protein
MEGIRINKGENQLLQGVVFFFCFFFFFIFSPLCEVSACE